MCWGCCSKSRHDAIQWTASVNHVDRVEGCTSYPDTARNTGVRGQDGAGCASSNCCPPVSSDRRVACGLSCFRGWAGSCCAWFSYAAYTNPDKSLTVEIFMRSQNVGCNRRDDCPMLRFLEDRRHRRFGMTAPVSITRTDGTPADLHDLAWKSKSAIMARRLMAVAMLRKGESRNMVAEACGVTVQTFRNWIVRDNTGGPEGLADLPRPPRPSHLGTEERSALASWVETGADAEADGVCRWRVVDLRDKVEATCGVSVSPATVRRTLPCHGVLSCLAAAASSQGGSCETGGVSSSSRMRGLRISAWAITIRWLSPPDMTLPLSPTTVNIFIGMSEIGLLPRWHAQPIDRPVTARRQTVFRSARMAVSIQSAGGAHCKARRREGRAREAR